MNREHAKEIWPFIKAFGEGNIVIHNGIEISHPSFFFAADTYTIKPKKFKQYYNIYNHGGEDNLGAPHPSREAAEAAGDSNSLRVVCLRET